MSAPSPKKLRGRKHNTTLLTNQMQHVFKAELARTGAKEATILSLLPSKFSAVTRQTLSAWRNGTRKTVSKAQWDAVLSALRSLPDKNSALSKPKS